MAMETKKLAAVVARMEDCGASEYMKGRVKATGSPRLAAAELRRVGCKDVELLRQLDLEANPDEFGEGLWHVSCEDGFHLREALTGLDVVAKWSSSHGHGPEAKTVYTAVVRSPEFPRLGGGAPELHRDTFGGRFQVTVSPTKMEWVNQRLSETNRRRG